MTAPRKACALTAALAMAVTLAACGGGDDASSKDRWWKKHGDLVGAYEKDLDAAGEAIGRGEKQATVSACTQLSDDAREMKDEVFPVPNPAMDAPLRASVDVALTGAGNCIQGGRSSAEHGARQVETAMKELRDARQKYLEAKEVFEAWQD